MGYSPWGHKELHITEQLRIAQHISGDTTHCAVVITMDALWQDIKTKTSTVSQSSQAD